MIDESKKPAACIRPAFGIMILFKFCCCANFLELGNNAFRVLFSHGFLDGAGGIVDHFFGFLEAKAGDLADRL